MDWRLGFNAMFYFFFSFMQSTVAVHEQKRGIRIALGIGIVFLFAEVHLIKAVEKAAFRGVLMDTNIEMIMKLFPTHYCAFEMIQVFRILYMLVFNICCLTSLVYSENEGETNIEYAKRIQENSQKISLAMKNIYSKQKGDY